MKVESGKLKMESGKWKVESGKWKMESGEWKMGKRELGIEFGKNVDSDYVVFQCFGNGF